MQTRPLACESVCVLSSTPGSASAAFGPLSEEEREGGELMRESRGESNPFLIDNLAAALEAPVRTRGLYLLPFLCRRL